MASWQNLAPCARPTYRQLPWRGRIDTHRSRWELLFCCGEELCGDRDGLAPGTLRIGLYGAGCQIDPLHCTGLIHQGRANDELKQLAPQPRSFAAQSLLADAAWISAGNGVYGRELPKLRLRLQLGALLAAIVVIVSEEVCTAHTEDRSEEHTSELQSLRHLVCRLL